MPYVTQVKKYASGSGIEGSDSRPLGTLLYLRGMLMMNQFTVRACHALLWSWIWRMISIRGWTVGLLI